MAQTQPDESPPHIGSEAGVVGPSIDEPDVVDGSALWGIARDSRVLDLNSSYAYLLWCRDFAATSAVAREDGRVVGFVTGYRRPDAPDTLLVWQVAVDSAQRGRGVARLMLDHLVDRLRPRGVRRMETTISPDNEASIRLFGALARDRGVAIERCDLFAAEDFPDDGSAGHQPEDLYVIGPFR